MARDNRGLRNIIQIDSELNKIQDADILLERILLEARRVVRAEAGTIYVKDGDILRFRYSQNAAQEAKLPPGQKLPYSNFTVEISDKTISGYVAKTGQLVNIPNVYRIPEDAPYSYTTFYDKSTNYRSTSMLTVPLVTSSGATLGVIQVINAKSESGRTVAFRKEDEVLITHFATNATIALQRAYQTRNMIQTLNHTAELRDSHETAAHVSRVSSYAAEIYERWAFKRNVPEKERDRTKDTLKLAAMLHDIGKVAISDMILKKPARFTDEEYSVIKAHTFCGAHLFTTAESEFESMAAVIALTHHERWDGTGYPGRVDYSRAAPRIKDITMDGATRRIEVWEAPALESVNGKPKPLKGEEIPLPGRIVAVADVFDALISRRVYKDSWEASSVYEEIRRQAGAQFDPEVVEAFFDVLPLIEQIRARYPDTNA
jgi:HD-GYP domain-containing protein (c-di-GMP phosphodiesterase class II)